MNNATQTQRPVAGDYGANYFETLYGAIPAQTIVDKLRDRLLRSIVYRYMQGGRLLEIGCGFGYLLGGFDTRFQCYGTDISAHAIGAAQRSLPDARLAVADIQDGVPFRETFDSVIAVNVMEHLAEPAQAMTAIAAHLRPGGLFVAHLPTISSPLAKWIYARTYASDSTHVYRPSGAEFNQLIEDAGFTTLQARYFPFWPAGVWKKLRPHPAYLGVFKRK